MAGPNQIVELSAGRDVQNVVIKSEIGHYHEADDRLVKQIGQRYCLIDRGPWFIQFRDALNAAQSTAPPKSSVVTFASRGSDMPELLLSRLNTHGWPTGQIEAMKDLRPVHIVADYRQTFDKTAPAKEYVEKFISELSGQGYAVDNDRGLKVAPLRLWIQIPSTIWDSTTMKLLTHALTAFTKLARSRQGRDALLICSIQLKGRFSKRRQQSFDAFWQALDADLKTQILHHKCAPLTAIADHEAKSWVTDHLDQSLHATMLNSIRAGYCWFGIPFFGRQKVSLSALTSAIDRCRQKGHFN